MVGAAQKQLTTTRQISTKLLARKQAKVLAMAKADGVEKLEDVFPAEASAPEWTAADEAAFRSLLARRKAAGYKTPRVDISKQRIKPGEIKPNANTVVATIVGLVEAQGIMLRAELLAAMAATTFASSKAKPQDSYWCQGYISGAIRNGFLAIEGEAG